VTSELKLSLFNGSSEKRGGKLHPHKFTMWIAIASILMMFAGLTSAFIVKSNLVGWREIVVPNVFWVSTVAIVASSLTLQLAISAFKQRKASIYRLLVALTFVLGMVFVALQLVGFAELWNNQNIKFTGVSGAGQFLYVIFGLHALHVLGGIVVLIVMLLKAYFGKIKVYSAVPIELAAIYWHFVDILWIYLLIFFLVIR